MYEAGNQKTQWRQLRPSAVKDAVVKGKVAANAGETARSRAMENKRILAGDFIFLLA